MSPSIPIVAKPWYREPWCWFVLTPLIAVMFVTGTLVSVAYIHSDDRVVDNYYKHGRMINYRLEQDVRARHWGISGELVISGQNLQLQLTTTTAMPQALSLWLDHPFEENLDHYLRLEHSNAGIYQAQLPVSTGNWYLTVAPEQRRFDRSDAPWRLRGDLLLRADSNIHRLQLTPPEVQ